jgi:hypothetical protein
MVDFHALHPELPQKVNIKGQRLVVIGEVTSNNPQTAADKHNAAILRQALLDDGPDGQDNDADPEEYGPVPAPSESASEWQLIDTQIKCNRTEEGHQPIRPGILRLQSTLGTTNLLTFFWLSCLCGTWRTAWRT